MASDYLSERGRELLNRTRAGVKEGKVSPGLQRDIEMVLLDGCEWHNNAIDRELKKVGA